MKGLAGTVELAVQHIVRQIFRQQHSSTSTEDLSALYLAVFLQGAATPENDSKSICREKSTHLIRKYLEHSVVLVYFIIRVAGSIDISSNKGKLCGARAWHKTLRHKNRRVRIQSSGHCGPDPLWRHSPGTRPRCKGGCQNSRVGGSLLQGQSQLCQGSWKSRHKDPSDC